MGVAGAESVAGGGEDSMGVAVEKMGRYAVNCKKPLHASHVRGAPWAREGLEAKEKYEMYKFYKENKC